MARVVVIGGGMSGLSLGVFLRAIRPGWELTVLEADSRPGGKAWTVREEGFLVERGVNGILDNKPSTLELARSLGVEPIRSFDSSRKRFVVKDGRLVKLPETPGEFLGTGLLSPAGKLRVMAEYLVPRGDMSRDESLAEFATRRLGKEAFERLIDPMAMGIYAGDPARLSLKACFPRIHELERDYGGLLKAMFAMKRAARKEGGKGPGAGPGGTLMSFERGMSQLAEAAAKALGGALRLSSRVNALERAGGLWQVHAGSGETIEATHVVLACPADQAGALLKEVSPDAAQLASGIYYPPVAVVALGFKKDALPGSLDGFGFLCPGRERKKILGCLWDSSIFESRAPEGYALVRVLAGGARNPRMVSLSDAELIHVVLKDLRDLMGVASSPDFVSIFRWEKAIPQYEVGHLERVSRLLGHLGQEDGIYVRCNWMGGVSLNDCVANSKALAMEIAA